ncbi:hypothetical protein AM571_PC00197 (plasmid) [Rhizobium etli 8C-3]|uniref:Uncharacterized protein n=3 Tax=Rhizobium TaxID=379 RepID=A0A4V2VD16_9HYPH|nr:hypothetical protein [Rhizobium etli]APO77939.1 hypothetical protein AM571_PC00197 [Rhizobium etli 8C-3]TCU30905.1 hypothetical protein EV130_101480 [Rhizobium azibense]TCU41076.1 hypothetical protein EV129_101363 [Rhizobium azibense]
MEQENSAADFAQSIEKWTDDEIFELLAKLEIDSESVSASGELEPEIQAKINIVETEIEARFPGQLLAPFKKWKQDRLGGSSATAE